MADDTQERLEQVSIYSVQSSPPDYYGAAMTQFRYGDYGNSLPSLYNPARQPILNRIATNPQASMWSASAANLIKQVASSPWRLKAQRRQSFFQDVLQNAELGRGWESFIQALLWDFLNNDDGAFMEVVGRGKPDKPLAREMVVGIRVLSPMYCWPTGNYEYPVWYQDAENGKFYRMHRTRVVRFVDQPFSDPRLRGRGFCALSRAMTYVQQAMTMSGYIGQMLDSNPPPGIAIWNNVISEAKVQQMWAAYGAALNPVAGVARGAYKPNAELINTSDDTEVKLNYVTFSQAPEGFSAAEYEKMQAAGIARSLGIDVQDVLALQGGAFGTGTQSAILAKKADGMMLAHLFVMLERAINARVLPDPVRFQFKTRDTQKSRAEAEITQIHVNTAASLAALEGVPVDAPIQYLVNNDESIQDVMTDKDGTLRILYDDDPEPDTAPETIVTDIDATEDPNAPAVNDTATEPQASNTPAPVPPQQAKRYKAFETVASSFRRRFAPVMDSINAGDVSGSRRADTIVRSVMRSEIMKAVIQGLNDGGVEVDTLTGGDMKLYTAAYADASKHITNLISRLWGFGEGRITRTQGEVNATVDMWIAKTLRDAYQKGLAAADANGMYEWVEGATKEKCKHCRALNGQRHRLSEYVKAGAMPGSSRLECKGYRCLCKLKKVKGRARGNLITIKTHWHGDNELMGVA